MPEPSPPLADEGSSPQLSPASRIKRPMFTSDPIPSNVDLRARDFHGEPYYDVPALTTNPRFRDSMRLITQYSLLPFMTPRQIYYPRVLLEFYNTMTSRGVPSPLELRFSIDSRPGVLRAMDITAALGLLVELANSGGYKDWPQPSQRKMVRCLAVTLQQDPYSSAGSFRHRCSLWTTYSGPACFHYSIMFSAEEPYSRLCTESHRDSGLVPLSLS